MKKSSGGHAKSGGHKYSGKESHPVAGNPSTSKGFPPHSGGHTVKAPSHNSGRKMGPKGC